MPSTDHDIDTINSLIRTTIDSAEGYREAADNAEASTYATLFRSRANERDGIVARLQEFVAAGGGDPVTGGSVSAGLHRAFLNLKDAITGNDDAAVIAEVERGEDHIKAKYEKARTDADLSGDARALIDSSYVTVRQGHDQMRDLKQATQDVSSTDSAPTAADDTLVPPSGTATF